MASTVIHMCVANEINKILKRDPRKLLIGTIAPDISKLVGENKMRAHFLDNIDTEVPNLEKFLNKYKHYLNDDFVLGYYIHLYTDYFWFKYFMTELVQEKYIKKIDGTEVLYDDELFIKYIYNDYTNINIKLIDRYELDLKIFYEEIPKITPIIEEIPMDKLNLIIESASVIIENTKVKKDLIFDIKNIEKFIDTTKNIIIDNLEA